jgi:hypothetical protein
VWGIGQAETIIEIDGRGIMLLPFVQGFYIEPLLRMQFARLGYGLVHACAVGVGADATLIAADARMGKTTFCLGEAVRGKPVIGDDYVILAPDGTVTRFPRRHRVYPDLRATCPGVYAGLAPHDRRILGALGLVGLATRGFVRLPHILDIRKLVSAAPVVQSARLSSVLSLAPAAGDAIEGPREVTADGMIDHIQQVNRAQATRLTLRRAGGPVDLHACMDAVDGLERDILRHALTNLTLAEIRVPRARDAAMIARLLRDRIDAHRRPAGMSPSLA